MERMRYEPEDEHTPGEAAHRRFVGLGEQQEVNAARQTSMMSRLDEETTYHEKAQTHLWVVFITHKAGDQILDAFDGSSGDLPLLDADTMLGQPAFLCYICEQAYEPRLRRRKCPGNPAPG